eukprot:13147487-Alexandrium_andersonii.AAC.1
MSASLVGSEMCIRDSSEARPKLSHLSRALRELSGALRSSPEAFRSSAAVSYTHLTLPTICSV